MNRSKYTFANINFLGKCNLDCAFCLGKDLEKEFAKYNTMNTDFGEFPNILKYLSICKTHNIKQIYLTGQNTDPLIYRYLDSFIDTLHKFNFFVGIRTNGQLAVQNMDTINMCDTCMGDAVAYTILSLNDRIAKKITGNGNPNWKYILENTRPLYRVSIVVTRHNQNDILKIIKFLSKLKNKPQYIQIRRISTEYRQEILNEDIKAYYQIKNKMLTKQIKSYETAPIIKINDLEVCFWETTSTTANSINYFTNGVISEEYYIIKGYEKAKKERLTP